jgi:phenylacetate-CoA ligase
MDKEAIYLALPLPLQLLVLQAQGARIQWRRYGGSYGTIEAEVRRRASLDPEALDAYRRRRLAALLRAAASTPFWQGRFRDRGVDPCGPDPFAELAKLPILEKAEVRDRVREFLVPGRDPRTLVSRHTSGTTGSGLVFYETTECERETWATWWRYRYAQGITRTTRCGYFGGRSVVPLAQRRPPFWRMNYPGRQLMMSGYHLSKATVAAYARALERYAVTWVHGYPSLLALFAKYALDLGLPPLDRVTHVTTGAETLLALQAEQIRRAFPGARVAQHYGLAEGVANVSQCPAGSLHVDEDFSHVEFIPAVGDPGAYRIIGTNWTNDAFPLLRYDTGDVARVDHRPCACGSPWRTVESIDGRIEDFVVLPSGARIGRTDHIFKDMVNVVEAQIRQDRTDGIDIAVVKGRLYSDEDERMLVAEARKRLGDELAIRIVYETSLPRTRSGKTRLVVSRLRNAQVSSAQAERSLNPRPVT